MCGLLWCEEILGDARDIRTFLLEIVAEYFRNNLNKWQIVNFRLLTNDRQNSVRNFYGKVACISVKFYAQAIQT
jgi:hypothetical protein